MPDVVEVQEPIVEDVLSEEELTELLSNGDVVLRIEK